MPRLILLPALCGTLALAGCPQQQRPDDLPGPAINLLEVVPADSARERRSSRGEMEMYLTPREPSHTFWNDPEAQTKPWGTITLKRVEDGGTVVVDFGGRELRAKPGETFAGTGVKVIASHEALGTALLRTRWTHTVMPGPR